MSRRVVAAAALLVATAGAAPGQEASPLLLAGGRIWTNAGDVGGAPAEADALLVVGERIVWVGTEAEAPARAASARRIDLRGHRVVPGFNDAHTHLFDGGATLLAPDLLTSDTPQEFVRRLAAHVATLPPGRWVDLNAAWDHERWPGHPLPSRALIDSVSPENPVWMRRPDGHIGLANSLALDAAGIGRDTPDPPGGQIDRDPATGEPTGILRDAGELVRRAMPETSEAEIRERLEAALAHAARLGVTTLQDMCYEVGPVGIRLLAEYARQGRLTARVYCRTALAEWEHPAAVGIVAGYGDDRLRMGSLKTYADGALGSSTAYLHEPYADDPSNRGLLGDVMLPPDTFYVRAAGADRARLQLSVHAIGDAAIGLVLDQLERIRAANPPWDRRFRIEHAQHMAPGDFARMADLGVVASVQPFHAIDDGRWAERKIGPERAKTTYAFRTFLDAGVRLAFGTDWPVAPLEPMRTVYAAVTRRTLEGAHDPDGWVPEERISVAEALRAYTSGSAYAEFADDEKGRLVPGHLADLVVLSDDPWTVEPGALGEIEALVTIVGGRVVHAGKGWEDLRP